MGQTLLTPQHLLLFLMSLCILVVFICYIVYIYYQEQETSNIPIQKNNPFAPQDKQFSIEFQYQQCLKLLGINESKLPDVERMERKRMFYSACGQILMICTEELPADEIKAAELLEKMIKECESFWIKETELLESLHKGDMHSIKN